MNTTTEQPNDTFQNNQQGELTQEDNTIAILTHVLGLFAGFLGPLIVYLLVQDGNAKAHAKMALNWQLSLLIYMIPSSLLIFAFFVGIPIIIGLSIANIVFCIMAAVKASKGQLWKYPITITLIK